MGMQLLIEKYKPKVIFLLTSKRTISVYTILKKENLFSLDKNRSISFFGQGRRKKKSILSPFLDKSLVMPSAHLGMKYGKPFFIY